MKPGVLAAIASAGLACATAPRPADAPHKPADGPQAEKALPIPADLAPRIEESIALGRIIYLLDRASAIGTDVLRDKVPDVRERGLGGWLTVREQGAQGSESPFWVLFVTKETPARLAFRIHVPMRGEPTLEEISPPTLLDDAMARALRARETALAAVPRGRRGINPVILPGSAVGRPDSILVYLLAAEHRAGEMVFGMHYRVLVSGDGATVQQLLPLSKSALVVGPPGEDKDVIPGSLRVAVVVSQLVTDWPLETHVFVSLLHKRAPIYVATARGTWLVIGDQIKLVDDKPPRPR